MDFEAQHQRATQLLREGRFHEAWPLYEARRWMSGTTTLEPVTDYPEWLGEDVNGKTVMVVAEQGFGDQLMFARYLPALAARGANIQLLCHPSIWLLFGGLGYSGHPYIVNAPAPPADYWVLMGSLPLRLAIPELPPAVYMPRATGRGVGVKTSGSPTHVNDAFRSLPPRAASRLLSMGRDLDPTATGARSFRQTAEIIAALELVVSVDTSVVHLAGAMGKPCWVLLPRQGLDWRWGDGVQSSWYPEMRLIRQETDGDWDAVLDVVCRDLAGVKCY